MPSRAPMENPLDCLDRAEEQLSTAWVNLLDGGEDPTGFAEESRKLSSMVLDLRNRVAARMPALDRL